MVHAALPVAGTRAATEVSRYSPGAQGSSNTGEEPRFLKERKALGKFIVTARFRLQHAFAESRR